MWCSISSWIYWFFNPPVSACQVFNLLGLPHGFRLYESKSKWLQTSRYNFDLRSWSNLSMTNSCWRQSYYSWLEPDLKPTWIRLLFPLFLVHWFCLLRSSSSATTIDDPRPHVPAANFGSELLRSRSASTMVTNCAAQPWWSSAQARSHGSRPLIPVIFSFWNNNPPPVLLLRKRREATNPVWSTTAVFLQIRTEIEPWETKNLCMLFPVPTTLSLQHRHQPSDLWFEILVPSSLQPPNRSGPALYVTKATREPNFSCFLQKKTR